MGTAKDKSGAFSIGTNLPQVAEDGANPGMPMPGQGLFSKDIVMIFRYPKRFGRGKERLGFQGFDEVLFEAICSSDIEQRFLIVNSIRSLFLQKKGREVRLRQSPPHVARNRDH